MACPWGWAVIADDPPPSSSSSSSPVGWDPPHLHWGYGARSDFRKIVTVILNVATLEPRTSVMIKRSLWNTLGHNICTLLTAENDSGVLRCGEHSDWASITLLYQDDEAGLEVGQILAQSGTIGTGVRCNPFRRAKWPWGPYCIMQNGLPPCNFVPLLIAKVALATNLFN